MHCWIEFEIYSTSIERDLVHMGHNSVQLTGIMYNTVLLIYMQDIVNGYRCACPVGFYGVNCETDRNECLSQPCQNGANCTVSTKDSDFLSSYSLPAFVWKACSNGETLVLFVPRPLTEFILQLIKSGSGLGTNKTNCSLIWKLFPRMLSMDTSARVWLALLAPTVKQTSMTVRATLVSMAPVWWASTHACTLSFLFCILSLFYFVFFLFCCCCFFLFLFFCCCFFLSFLLFSVLRTSWKTGHYRLKEHSCIIKKKKKNGCSLYIVVLFNSSGRCWYVHLHMSSWVDR